MGETSNLGSRGRSPSLLEPIFKIGNGFSIRSRVCHSVQAKARDLHLTANTGDYHGDAGVLLAKIEEQDDTTIRLAITVQKLMFAQVRNQSILDLDLFSQRPRTYMAQDCHEMQRFVRIGRAYEFRVSSKLFKKIAYGLFVIGRMQHPLAQLAEVVRKIFGGGIHWRCVY